MDPSVSLKAFEFAKDLTTQLITLATGTIALTITFSKDFLRSNAPRPRRIGHVRMGLLLLLRCSSESGR